jgi:lysophospholipase L1-like esterase
MRDLNRNVLSLHLTVLGDSLAHGTGASTPENGFASIVYRSLVRHVAEHSLVNLSVPGATINDVLAWQVGHLPVHADATLLVVGSNDVPNATDPAQFGVEYGRLLGKIRAASPFAPLFVTGIPNIAVTPQVPDEAKPFIEALCLALSTEIEMQAATHQADFIDLYEITNRANGHASKYLAEDNFHPSNRGHALLARGALSVIASRLAIG